MNDTPPPVPPSPQTAPTSDEKIWIIFCHLSLILGVGLLLPLVVYLVKKQDSPLVAENAKEALNFHISVCIYVLVSLLLTLALIGFLLLFAVIIGSLVLAIVACIKASEGKLYRYPLTLRLVR